MSVSNLDVKRQQVLVLQLVKLCFVEEHNQISIERMKVIQEYCNENAGLSVFDQKRFNHILTTMLSPAEMNQLAIEEINKSLDITEINDFIKIYEESQLPYFLKKELEACSIHEKVGLKEFIAGKIDEFDEDFWDLIDEIDVLTGTSHYLVKRNNFAQSLIEGIANSKNIDLTEKLKIQKIIRDNKEEYEANSPGLLLLAYTYQNDSRENLYKYIDLLHQPIVEDTIFVIKNAIEKALEPAINHYQKGFKLYFNHLAP